MDDQISAESTRENSPYCEDNYNGSSERYATTSTSIAELSQHFDHHSITTRRPAITMDHSNPNPRDFSHSIHSTSSFSNRVYRQRQNLSNLHHSSPRISRISALVEDMVETGLPTYDSLEPLSRVDESSTSPSLSPEEQPPPIEASYFGFTPVTASSAGPLASARHSQSYKIDKELRHSASRDAIGGQKMVKKKVRMRRSFKSLRKGTGKRAV
ncbi:hypothetical protein ACLMJK_008461 [Lecanora helva]